MSPVDDAPTTGRPEGHGAATQGDPAEATAGRFLATWQWVVLAVALAFTVGAIAYVVADRRGARSDLSATDVGFLQDMNEHHASAVELSTIILGKDGIDAKVRSFAQEVIITQQYDRGTFTGLLAANDEPAIPADELFMSTMGPGVPLEQMDGMPSDEEIDALKAADGDDASALWIALMSEHHLGGLHMADWEARKGSDALVVDLAAKMVQNQRAEVFEYQWAREELGLTIPEGFDDPLQDQRLNPISFTEGLAD